MPDKYAVIGNPIHHSRSPEIHQAFALQTRKVIAYSRILAPLDAFAATLETLVADGFRGANVTVPFKLQAYHSATQLTERAMDARAVNTLSFKDGEIIGDNTDGAGLVSDIIRNLGLTFQNKRILLIGAGGAAEGVLNPILEQQPELVVIANRTLDKALRMVKKVEQQGDFKMVTLNAYAFERLHGQSFDIVINATSAGLSDSHLPLPEDIFASGALAYDMMYGRETPFMSFARTHGAKHVSDGLGMLIEQAAEAFNIWHGVRPLTKPVIDNLKAG